MVLEEDDGELLPTRQSLLERLRLWEDSSWREFFETYWKLIYRAARGAGLRPLDAEEVVQETVVAVARLLPDFHYRPAAEGGSFKTWLLNQTRWRIADHFRRQQRNQRFVPLNTLADEDGRETVEIPDPLASRLEQQWEAEWEKNLMDAAVEHVKQRVDPRHYQIFDFNVTKGWPAMKVAHHLKVTLPQVYTVAHRVSKQVRERFNHLREHEV